MFACDFMCVTGCVFLCVSVFLSIRVFLSLCVHVCLVCGFYLAAFG